MIESSHLSKVYRRGVYALRDLSLTIDKGEFLFLTGPSGSGKSTLLRLLLREELPTEGLLKVGGRNHRQSRPRLVARNHESVSRDERARHDRDRGDARPRDDPARGSPLDHTRARPRG